MKIKDPKIIKNVFNNEDFLKIQEHLKSKTRNSQNFEPFFGRYICSDTVIEEYLHKLVPIAKEIFDSKTLIPSYALFAHYEGKNASLFSHVDDNACTYTLDMCLYQNDTWELYVNEKPYVLNENEALAYYGNDQIHRRDPIPNPESQHVAMVFFHFVEPDHWWHTKGPGYLDVIRNHITEKEWEKRNNLPL
jgi:hypothetical protein